MEGFDLRKYLYNNPLLEGETLPTTQSAGLLMYKIIDGEIYVFIAKLGGKKWVELPENWTIPKGNIDAGESPLEAAIREFEEETGIQFGNHSNLIDLGKVSLTDPLYPKDVRLWAFEGDGTFKNSNTFKEEWPEGSGKYITSPEIQTAEFHQIDQAQNMVHSYQKPAFSKLKDKLNNLAFP
jgi:predicted NUDIX family NTP pyrophosphohydrolase